MGATACAANGSYGAYGHQSMNCHANGITTRHQRGQRRGLAQRILSQGAAIGGPDDHDADRALGQAGLREIDPRTLILISANK